MTSFKLRKNTALNLFEAGDFLLFCVAQRFKFGAEPLLALGSLLASLILFFIPLALLYLKAYLVHRTGEQPGDKEDLQGKPFVGLVLYDRSGIIDAQIWDDADAFRVSFAERDFLRVRGGDNPLDATAVHPERYPVVQQMAAQLQVPLQELIGNPEIRAAYLGG